MSDRALAIGSKRATFSPNTLRYATCGLGVMLAVALRVVWHTNGDVSWLLEAAQRTLDGAVPYRDFIEVNPPASILIYMPAVMLAHLTGTSPERMSDALVFVAAALSLALCGSILRRARLLDPSRAGTLLCLAILVLLILPLYSFAQREHIAVLAILPSLATFAARVRGERPRAAQCVLAGIGAAIVISLKPVFVLAFVGPVLYLLWHRSWRVVLRMPEAWIACCTASIYGLGVVLLVPDFVDRVLPLLVRIYVPARLPFLDLLASPVSLIWLAFVYTFWRVGWRTDAVGTVLVLASAGLEASFFVQGKGFLYHGYPAVALAALGSGHALLKAGCDRPGGRVAPLVIQAPAAAALVAGLLVFAEYYDMARIAPGLTQAIAAISMRPRLLTIGTDMTLCRVLAREVGGEWVGSSPIAWITLYANAITRKADEDPRFADAIRMERDLYAEDIERRRPDVVLIDGDGWWRWTRHSAALVQALSQYRRVGQYGEVALWRRASSSPAAEPGVPSGGTSARPASPPGDIVP